jgi:O-antigen/teichoic acid export membrane protein
MSLKNLTKDTLIYSVGTIIIRVSAFILIPFYTHSLSVSDYGLLSALLLTSQIIIPIVDFGVVSSLMRFMKEFDESNSEGDLLGSSILINLFAGFFIIVISGITLGPIFKAFLQIEDVFVYAILVSTASVMQSLCVNTISYFRARNQGLKFTIFSVAVAIIVSALTILFVVKFGLGIKGVFESQIIGYFLLWVIPLKVISGKVKYEVSKKTLIKLIKFGFPLIFARSGDLIKSTIAIYMLTYFVGLEQVGIFSLATKLTMIVQVILILPFQLSYEPYIYSNIGDPHLSRRISKITTYLLVAFVVVSFSLVFVFRGLMGIIAPPAYFSAYYLIFLLMPAQVFRGFTYISQSLLLIKEKSNLTGIVSVVSTVLSIILSYFCIKYYGIMGNIFAINIYWLGLGLALFILGQREIHVKIETVRLIILGLINLLSLVGVYLLADSPAIVFYSILPLSFIMILWMLYILKFFDSEEKQMIRKSFKKFQYKLLPFKT